jgi:hypothetical protein
LSQNKVVLVRQGSKYDKKYVELLSKQINTDVITLTDQADTPGKTLRLKYGWPGWWSKLELFSPEVEDLRPFLYIDLDSYVLDNIDHYFGGPKFKMVDEFNGWGKSNSSVMWIPKDVNRIWEAWIADPELNMAACGGHGDQKFLGDYAEELWTPLESGIVSYKNHCVNEPVGTIVQFHGRPKPHEINDGWVADIWQS